uniref:O-methyltransferase domain-containing protein n=1 Tax=Bicosoecida sp. CB-2014 TaxID=1486930 RepID=A0A7S1CFQ6_9STRA
MAATGGGAGGGGGSGLLPFPSGSATVSDKLVWDVWMSQHHLTVTTVALNLGLFDWLHGKRAAGGATATEVAAGLSTGPRSTEAVLAVLGGLGFLRCCGGKFTLTEEARNFLLKDSPFFWGHMLQGDKSGDAYTRLLKAVENDRPSAGAWKEWQDGELSDERAAFLTAEMHSHSLTAAFGVGAAVDFSGVTRFLDVAGGSGVFTFAVCRANEGVSGTVLELPAVCRLVEGKYRPADLAERVDTTSLNMFTEDWPEGYQVHFFSNIFHDWSREQCVGLARSSFKALPSGGRIMLHEMLLNDAKDGGLTAACFSIHMLIHTPGKQYSLEDLRSILGEAGFVDVKAQATHPYYSIVTGTKP